MRKIHQSKCVYTTFWGIILALIFSVQTQKTFFAGWFWFCAALGLLIISLIISKWPAVFLAFLAGVIFAHCRITPEINSLDYLNDLTGKILTLRGDISEDPDLSEGKTTLRLKNLELLPNSPNEPSIKLSGVAYVQLAKSTYDLERSDKITIKGALSPGFGTFAGVFYRPSLEHIERNSPGDIFARLKNWFADVVRGQIPSPESDLGLSYLLGLKSNLPDNLSDALRIAGMTHVVVASGTHLGILAGAAKQLFGRISRFAGLLAALLLICSFVMMVGFTPSMTRAALVSILALTFGYFGRKFSQFRLITLVACLTLLITPNNFLNLGWQLSFASFFGILILAPRLTKSFYGGKTPPWLASMLITSLATSLICSPILIYNFGSISFLSFVANLIILPTLPYVMCLTFFSGILVTIPYLSDLIAWLTKLSLDFHILVINFLSGKTMFVLELSSGDLRFFILYIPILVFLIWPKCRHLISKNRTPKLPVDLNTNLLGLPPS